MVLSPGENGEESGDHMFSCETAARRAQRVEQW